MRVAGIEPKLKMCVTAAVFVIVFVFLAICFVGCGDTSSADMNEIPESITARDVNVEYDGLWHSIVVENLADGDEVLYSTIAGGEYLSERPQYKFPGEYIVYYKVIRSGSEIFGGSARITIRKAILTGISAEPIAVIFDGNEHGISVSGIEDDDRVEYSLDGENFSAIAPTFTEVGEYRVFYAVERTYGEYRSSGSILILPDLRGVYVDLRMGMVTLGDFSAAVNGKTSSMSYGLDGRGTIGDTEFSVIGGTLNFDGATYEKIGDDEKIFVLTVAGNKFYLHSAQVLTAEISIIDDTAVVAVGDNEITAVDDVNYCENADTENYAERSFVITLSEGENVLELSKRQTRTLSRKEIFHIYDGESVDLDIEYDEVLFKTANVFVDESPRLCEVGEYDIEAVVLSDEYLPTFLSIYITIAPNIDGVYYSATAAVKIVGADVWLNGERLRAEYDNGWVIAGQAVTPTDGGIEIGGENFISRTERFVVIIEVAERRYVFQTLKNDIKVEWTSDETVIYIADEQFAVAPASDRSITVNSAVAAIIDGDDGSFCVIGLADLHSEIIIIRIGAVA